MYSLSAEIPEVDLGNEKTKRCKKFFKHALLLFSMNISTDFLDVVEDLLIVILLVVFLYLLYYNFKKEPVKENSENTETTERKLFEIDMREEDLNQKKKGVEKEIEDKKKDYLKGRVKRDDYKSFLRAKHSELVSLKSKLNK
jgi:Ca2+/Na+ antiporter